VNVVLKIGCEGGEGDEGETDIADCGGKFGWATRQCESGKSWVGVSATIKKYSLPKSSPRNFFLPLRFSTFSAKVSIILYLSFFS
jgi:hypothetical protein